MRQVMMAVVVAAAVSACGGKNESSSKQQAPPQTPPTGAAEGAAAASLTFLGFRLWMSAAEARAQIAAAGYQVTSDSAGLVEASGEYAGHPAKYQWNFTRSGNLQGFSIIPDYGGAEAPAASPFHPVVKEALADLASGTCVANGQCEWLVGDDRVSLSVSRGWPKGASKPNSEWHIDMLSLRGEPEPDPAVVRSQRLSAAGASAQKRLEAAGVEVPVSPTQCLDWLEKSDPARALAIAECLEQACEREEVAEIPPCLADCPKTAPAPAESEPAAAPTGSKLSK